MRKLTLYLIILAVAFAITSCASTTPDGPISDKPILNVTASDTVYRFYGLDNSYSVLDVAEIDDYEDLTDNLVVVNASSVDIKELSMSFVGPYSSKNLVMKYSIWSGSYLGNSTTQSEVTTPVLLDIFKDINANSKKKFDLDGKELNSFKYLIFNVESPADAKVKITYVEELHDDLYIYFTDV